MNGENVVRIDSTRKGSAETNNIIVLYDLGYDTGRYENVKIQLGLVDARCVKSAISENEGGYQRLVTIKRIEYITNDFHWSRFNPIIISLRKDGEIYNVDGQARVCSVKHLYEEGLLDSPMIPCIILSNTTVKDEAMLFGTQYDGTTRLNATQCLRSKYIGMDDETLEISSILSKAGIDLFKNIKAHKTIKTIYNDLKKIDITIFSRICNVIGKAWINGTKAPKKECNVCRYFNWIVHILFKVC